MLKLLLPLIFVLFAISLHGITGSEIRTIKEITEGPYQNYSGRALINLGDKYYYFESNLKANWYSSIEFCRNIGLHVVAVETTEENDLIIDYVQQTGIQDYWLGGSSFAVERQYVWMATGERATFLGWHTGEPNHTPGDRVLHLRFDHGILAWNDERPYAEYGIICEQYCDASCQP